MSSAIVAKLSGHSMRVGAAQDMAAAGIDLGAIMHAGGWKTPEIVMRYIEHMDVQNVSLRHGPPCGMRLRREELVV
jgi:hypothetical protein